VIEPAAIRKCLHALCLLLAAGCASIVSKSDYDVAVDCNSPGFTVNIYKDDELVTSTVAPSVVTLSSRGGYFIPASYRFKFEKEGFSAEEVELDASFDWWYMGNILFGELIGALIVDPLTGAMWKFEEDASVFAWVRANEQKPGRPMPRQPETRAESVPIIANPLEHPTGVASNSPPQVIEIESITL